MSIAEIQKIETQTLSTLATEYHCDWRTFKKLIRFLQPQLDKLQILDTPLFTSSQLALIRYKLGTAKDRKYTYTVIADLIGIDLNTLLYSWLKKPVHQDKLKELQPNRINVLTPRQVDYIFSLLDVTPNEIN